MNTYFVLFLIVAQIMTAEFLFTRTFSRRKLFYLRFLGYGVVTLVASFWIQALYVLLSGKDYVYGAPTAEFGDSLFNLLFYLAIFAMTGITCYLSYNEPLEEILFSCSGAYAIQHIAHEVTNLFGLIPVYREGILGQALTLATTFVVFAGIYTAAYFFLIKPQGGELHMGNRRRKVIISLTVILICIVMSRLTSDNANRDWLSAFAESVYSIMCCCLILYVEFAVSENDSMRLKVDSMSELLRSERKQFELSKETIDLINIKCHDMKYQIARLRGNLSEENIDEIERAIMIYDSAVKTGNDALDVILTENKLRCEDKKIVMTCLIRGELLSFMDDADIYSLFGNALSNAIESVAKVQDEEKRCISVSLSEFDGTLFLHIENYFAEAPDFKDGLPLTDKNQDYHGFGMKSMERIARKYGGEISASISGIKFNLDVILPVPLSKG